MNRTMQSEMPTPLPSAVKNFKAGEMNHSRVTYPKLPRSPVVRVRGITYPPLVRVGHPPATKIPAGYTMPIMTKHGAHAPESSPYLPRH
jgi:hypothetical protein